MWKCSNGSANSYFGNDLRLLFWYFRSFLLLCREFSFMLAIIASQCRYQKLNLSLTSLTLFVLSITQCQPTTRGVHYFVQTRTNRNSITTWSDRFGSVPFRSDLRSLLFPYSVFSPVWSTGFRSRPVNWSKFIFLNIFSI